MKVSNLIRIPIEVAKQEKKYNIFGNPIIIKESNHLHPKIVESGRRFIKD